MRRKTHYMVSIPLINKKVLLVYKNYTILGGIQDRK